ncbi:MAG: type II toxin-antitoxin system VapC family toxin [Planctomycetes bacterium]|nr:type II toxin-antitoxin system VapC family toxin [Planctomycetota bacterium]
MTRWLLDSNVWIEGVGGVPHAVKAVLRAGGIDWCGFSAISRLEVLGFPGLTAGDERRLEELLAQFHEVAVSPAVIEEAIRVRKEVRIRTPDAMIAATALLEKADLVTRNVSDFRGVPGLRVIDPETL